MRSTFLDKHPDAADDECEEGPRPVELVYDLGALDDVDRAAVEVRLADFLVRRLEVSDEDEAGGGECAQEEGAAVEEAQSAEKEFAIC